MHFIPVFLQTFWAIVLRIEVMGWRNSFQNKAIAEDDSRFFQHPFLLILFNGDIVWEWQKKKVTHMFGPQQTSTN